MFKQNNSANYRWHEAREYWRTEPPSNKSAEHRIIQNATDERSRSQRNKKAIVNHANQIIERSVERSLKPIEIGKIRSKIGREENKMTRVKKTMLKKVSVCLLITVILLSAVGCKSSSNNSSSISSGKSSNSSEADLTKKIKVTMYPVQYTYDSSYDSSVEVALYATNNNNIPVSVSANITIKDSSNKTLGTDYTDSREIPAGQSAILSAYFPDGSNYSSAEYKLDVNKNTALPNNYKDIELSVVKNSTNVIATVKNNSKKKIDGIGTEAIFIKNGAMVCHSEGYVGSYENNGTIKAGESLSNQMNCELNQSTELTNYDDVLVTCTFNY